MKSATIKTEAKHTKKKKSGGGGSMSAVGARLKKYRRAAILDHVTPKSPGWPGDGPVQR